MKPREHSQMTQFQLISSELVTSPEFKISFLIKTYYITLDTYTRKMRLVADVTAEIFKFENGNVGNFVKYICSAQSKNRYSSRIVLRKVGILTLLRNSGIVTVQF